MRRQNQPLSPHPIHIEDVGLDAAAWDNRTPTSTSRTNLPRIKTQPSSSSSSSTYSDSKFVEDTLKRPDKHSSYGHSIQSPGVPRAISLPKRIYRAIRHPRRRWRARTRLILLFLLTVFSLDAWIISSHKPHGTRIRPSENQSSSRPRIFIAGIHRNNEAILRSHWNKAVLDLVRFYGVENVYVSLFESGSLEDTKGALRDLDMELGNLRARRSVVLDPIDQIVEVGRKVVHKEDDWIWTSRDRFELRRIPYLANLRNRVMAKLYDEANEGRKYDFVLWINDVVFNTEDITTLLATNDGQYDAVCSMDYAHAEKYYDTFALRDISGGKVGTRWPYFSDRASSNLLINLQPIPVRSCWNGIVAFHSAPFYDSPALQFRGIPDSLAAHHLEGSECCLIHADNKHGESAAGKKGVWLNPNVRVGYSGHAYQAVNPKSGVWPATREKVLGYWTSRINALIVWPKRWIEDVIVRRRVSAWNSEEEVAGHDVVEPGEHCLINEMQVLEEAGWRHL